MESVHEMGIQTLIGNLPDSVRQEAIDFVEFLSIKYPVKEQEEKKFKFDWTGALSHIKTREKLTSVELQHKSLRWR